MAASQRHVDRIQIRGIEYRGGVLIQSLLYPLSILSKLPII